MLKMLVSGVVIVGATLGGAWFAIDAGAKGGGDSAKPAYFGGLDYVKTDVFGVPIIEDGKLEGYIVTQWVFTMEAKVRAAMSVPAEIILAEEAFRAIYGEVGLDFDSLDRVDFDALSASMRDKVNARLEAGDAIKDVMVQKFDYVERGAVRDAKARSLLTAPPAEPDAATAKGH